MKYTHVSYVSVCYMHTEYTLWWTCRGSNPGPQRLRFEGITTILYLRFFTIRFAVRATTLLVARHTLFRAMITCAYVAVYELRLVFLSLLDMPLLSLCFNVSFW